MLFVSALQGGFLPPLPLVAAQIVNVKGSIRMALRCQHSLHVNKAFTARVDGKPSEITHDPPAAHPFRNGSVGPRTTKEVGNQIAFARR